MVKWYVLVVRPAYDGQKPGDWYDRRWLVRAYDAKDAKEQFFPGTVNIYHPPSGGFGEGRRETVPAYELRGVEPYEPDKIPAHAELRQYEGAVLRSDRCFV